MSKRDLWDRGHNNCPERQCLRPDQQDIIEDDNNFGSQSQLLSSDSTTGRGIKNSGGLAASASATTALAAGSGVQQGPVVNLRLEAPNSVSLSLGRGGTPANSEPYLAGSSSALAASSKVVGRELPGLSSTPAGAVSAASLAVNTSASKLLYCYIYLAIPLDLSSSLIDYCYYYLLHLFSFSNWNHAVVQFSSGRWLGCPSK